MAPQTDDHMKPGYEGDGTSAQLAAFDDLPKLCTSIPSWWWDRAEDVKPSTEKWDSSHLEWTEHSRKVCNALLRMPSDARLDRGFRFAHSSLARHRYVVPNLPVRAKLRDSMGSGALSKSERSTMEAARREAARLAALPKRYQNSEGACFSEYDDHDSVGILTRSRRGKKSKKKRSGAGSDFSSSGGARGSNGSKDGGEHDSSGWNDNGEDGANSDDTDGDNDRSDSDGEGRRNFGLASSSGSGGGEAGINGGRNGGGMDDSDTNSRLNGSGDARMSDNGIDGSTFDGTSSLANGGRKGKQARGRKSGGNGTSPGPGTGGSSSDRSATITWRPTNVKEEDMVAMLSDGAPDDWDPNGSVCWAPRIAWADAKALVDTQEVERKRFDNDWVRVASELGMSKLVTKRDDDGTVDADDDGIPDEVEDVQAVLWEYHQAIGVIFDFYAAMGSDVNNLALNMWTMFTTDFALADKKSKFCKQSDLDTLFITIDGVAARNQKQKLKEEESTRRVGDKKTSKFEDKRQRLSRVEFYSAIVMMAIKVYVDTKEISDISEAIERFINVKLLPKLQIAHASPTVFRLRHLYTKALDAVLEKRLPSLRTIFEGLVKASQNAANRRPKLLSLTDWLGFLKAAAVTGADVSERDATLCYCWSRMCVIDERTEIGYLREVNLPFEGFVEAICRLSTLKALPTDAEVAAAKSPNAARYLHDLMLEDDDAYKMLVRERAAEWGSEPSQPLPRCVEHTCSTIFFAIHVALGGNPSDDCDADVNAVNMARWIERAMSVDSKATK